MSIVAIEFGAPWLVLVNVIFFCIYMYNTIMSLLEAPGTKALSRAIFHVMGVFIVCYYHMIA